MQMNHDAAADNQELENLKATRYGPTWSAFKWINLFSSSHNPRITTLMRPIIQRLIDRNLFKSFTTITRFIYPLNFTIGEDTVLKMFVLLALVYSLVDKSVLMI